MTQRRYIGVITLFNLALLPCTVAILIHVLSFGPSEVRRILKEWQGPLRLFVPEIEQRVESWGACRFRTADRASTSGRDQHG